MEQTLKQIKSVTGDGLNEQKKVLDLGGEQNNQTSVSVHNSSNLFGERKIPISDIISVNNNLISVNLVRHCIQCIHCITSFVYNVLPLRMLYTMYYRANPHIYVSLNFLYTLHYITINSNSSSSSSSSSHTMYYNG